MARRISRRRRPNVQWMPVFGNGPTDDDLAIGVDGYVDLAGDGSIRFDAVPLTFDYSDSAEAEQFNLDRSLQDLVSGNGWRLRRIVGKYHAAYVNATETPNPTVNVPAAIDVAAGFILVRTDDSGNPTTDFSVVNPLHQDSADDPWIWRRRWMLKTSDASDAGVAPLQDYRWAQGLPRNTAGAGSVADGPHIDQKTARVIDRQERLFFVTCARPYSVTEQAVWAAPGAFAWHLDYRLLGSLRRSSPGNRGNASR